MGIGQDVVIGNGLQRRQAKFNFIRQLPKADGAIPECWGRDISATVADAVPPAVAGGGGATCILR